MKQLSSFIVLNINGGDRVSFTYDEINENTGELTSSNNKASFYAVDSVLKQYIEAIRSYIREKKLEG
jgi:hypothetical protein